jgi:hypothetical protein
MISVDSFIDELLAARGFKQADIAPEVFEELRHDLVIRLQERVNAEMISALRPEQVTELEALMGRPETTEDQLRSFFERHLSNIDERTQRVLEDFKSTYLAAPQQV